MAVVVPRQFADCSRRAGPIAFLALHNRGFQGSLAVCLGVLLVFGACRSSPRLASPTPPRPEPSARANATPAALAADNAGAISDDAGLVPREAESRDAGSQPLRVLRNHEQAEQVVDSLLGDSLVQAKKACSYEPPETRESCIDRNLQAQTDELEAQMKRDWRALQLLQKVAAAECASVPRSNPEKKQACVLGAMNRHLGLLEPECQAQSEKLEHQCLMQAVIRRFGP